MGGHMIHAISSYLKQISLIKIILTYDFKLSNFMNEKICIGNVRLFYFNNDG